jgi:hypothetical protein
MVAVKVFVGVEVGVPVRVGVDVTAGEEVDVPVGCGVSVGVTKGEGEIEGVMTAPAAGVSDPTSGSCEGTPEVRRTGKLHEKLRKIQTIPIRINRLPGFNWFQKRFI